MIEQKISYTDANKPEYKGLDYLDELNKEISKLPPAEYTSAVQTFCEMMESYE